MSKSNYQENVSLDSRYGSGSPATVRFRLFETWPGEAAGGTEITYTPYAAISKTNNAANFPAASSGTKSNGTAIDFDKRTDAGTDTARWVLTDDGTNRMDISAISSVAPALFTAATSDTLTVPGHALAVNDEVAILGTHGATLPGGITEGTSYFVKTVSGDAITLSATVGGATLDITSAGSGIIQKLEPLVITQNIAPQIITGAWSVYED